MKYTAYFLDGIEYGNESSFSFSILKYIRDRFDFIVIGCYSTPVQIFANLYMRIHHKPFFINFDGEVFLSGKTLKTLLKKIVIKGAAGYLLAGKKAAENLQEFVGKKPVFPYYFSSLFEKDLGKNAGEKEAREDFVLVIGQYLDYKGLDIAVQVARELPDIRFKFVGMGKRTEIFCQEQKIHESGNIEVIPFLQKTALNHEYKKCRFLLLPSRQECWGLVVNEAASFGTPIVSTLGSGAAVEFLADKYPEYLAAPGDVQSLKRAVEYAWNHDLQPLSEYLLKKSRDYSIEKSVQCHLEAFSHRKEDQL